MQSVLVGQFPWQLSAKPWLRNPDFSHFGNAAIRVTSKVVWKGRVSWTRHDCIQLPWPQDDTSICPCIRWWELSHATPYRCKGGWEIQFSCVPKKRKQAFWPPGQSVKLRQTQPIPDTQPEWPTGSPLVRQTLSQCQQGPERWSGSTVYLDRWA